ncbi:MAG: DegT/DnrJ/EryC1/StrS family aminotransferase [bacterium]|nr:DegT/DnrJ/EryC1/StrS family aminotransferase [bacterium]
MGQIPFVDLAAQYRLLKERIDAAVARVLEHGRFIMGPEVAELEAALCAFSGARHAIGVASGTDALLMALMSEGVGPGDAVFVPAFTFTASAEVIVLAGACPVFVDIDPRTFNIDTERLREGIASTLAQGQHVPRAVIAVDLFGLPADHETIADVASQHDLLVIDDAAQGFGARIGDARVGTLAPVTTTSFFPAKPLGAYGEGGAIFTQDEERAQRLRSIRNHGQAEATHVVDRIGINGRLDTLQAAVLLQKLTVFERELEARARLADHYDARLSEARSIETPVREDGKSSAWAQYSILVDERDHVRKRLDDASLPSAIYYPVPIHLQPAYARYSEGVGSLPICERLCQRILSLPMHPYMEDDTADRICDVVLEAVR